MLLKTFQRSNSFIPFNLLYSNFQRNSEKSNVQINSLPIKKYRRYQSLLHPHFPSLPPSRHKHTFIPFNLSPPYLNSNPSTTTNCPQPIYHNLKQQPPQRLNLLALISLDPSIFVYVRAIYTRANVR